MNRQQRRRQKAFERKGDFSGEDVRPRITALRGEAFEKRGEIIHKNAAGWSFSMSVDQNHEPHLKHLRASSPDAFMAMMAAMHVDATDYGPCKPDVPCDHDHMHLSARVFRSTTRDDWENFGLALGVAGVPRSVIDRVMPKIDDNHINSRAIHFVWHEMHD